MQEKKRISDRKGKRYGLRILMLTLLIVAGVGGFFMITDCSAAGSIRSAQLAREEISPQLMNGRFVNDLEAVEPPFFKTLGEWIRGGDNTTPEDTVPMVKLSSSTFESVSRSGLRVTWLGHSTSLVEIDGTRLLLDPVWSERTSPFKFLGPKRFFRPPLSLEELPDLDAVLISHDHYDHLDEATVIRLAGQGANFIVPLGIGARLTGWGIPNEQIVELDWWESTPVGPLTVTATPARHFSGRSVMMSDRNLTLWAGFAIRGPRHNVYYSGDSGMFDGFMEIGERLGPFDVALIEVGAYNRLWADYHLGPEQALQAARHVRAELLIPVHWGTFDLAMHGWTEPVERLLVAAAGDDVSLAIPKPGQSVEPSDRFALDRWWPEIPWESADEHPVISSTTRTAAGSLPAPGTR
jgi:L-ascorbate metabolism protein UlaG (beta-lactamase superfamily)